MRGGGSSSPQAPPTAGAAASSSERDGGDEAPTAARAPQLEAQHAHHQVADGPAEAVRGAGAEVPREDPEGHAPELIVPPGATVTVTLRPKEGPVMSIFRSTTQLAIAGVNPNLLNGSKFEFLHRAAVCTLWASDFGGAAASELTFTLGNVVVAENIPVNTAPVAGQIDTLRDRIGSGVGAAGDRIQIAARNTDAAAVTNVNIQLEISEL